MAVSTTVAALVMKPTVVPYALNVQEIAANRNSPPMIPAINPGRISISNTSKMIPRIISMAMYKIIGVKLHQIREWLIVNGKCRMLILHSLIINHLSLSIIFISNFLWLQVWREVY